MWPELAKELGPIWHNYEPYLLNLICYLANFHCCKWPKLNKPSGHLVTLFEWKKMSIKGAKNDNSEVRNKRQKHKKLVSLSNLIWWVPSYIIKTLLNLRPWEMVEANICQFYQKERILVNIWPFTASHLKCGQLILKRAKIRSKFSKY